MSAAVLQFVPGRVHTFGCGALLVLGLLCSGCRDALYWYGRTVYGVDCTPEVVQAHHGTCVYVKKGQTHAETLHP